MIRQSDQLMTSENEGKAEALVSMSTLKLR